MHGMNGGAEDSEHWNTFSEPPPHFWQGCLFILESFRRPSKSLKALYGLLHGRKVRIKKKGRQCLI